MLNSAQRQWLDQLVVVLGARAPAADAQAGARTAAAASAPGAEVDPAAAAIEKKGLIARITRAKNNVDAAIARYEDQKKISEDQWLISGLARAAKEVTSLGDFEDPGPALTKILAEVRASARTAVEALNRNDLASADGLCTRIDDLATKAQELAHCYSEDLIDGAETAKTSVKVIDTGAKVVGGVALTVATGGAAAGVVAAEIGTATAISVAGGVAASTAGVATKLALGEKVDWGLFSIDILMQGLLARFGGKLTEGIAAAVAKRLGPMAATVGGAVIKNVAAQVVMHVDTTLFRTALDTVYRKLAGKDLTLQQIYDACIEQLTDPSSLVVLAATAAAQGHVDAKAAATAPRPAEAARPAAVAPEEPAPAGAAKPPPGPAEEAKLFSAEDIDKAFSDDETGGFRAAGDLVQLGPHAAASRNRAELQVSGKEVESGHLAPRSVMKKNVVDYNAEHALTVLLKKGDHKGMDAAWKDDFKAMRAAGETTATAQTIFDTVANAIRRTPGMGAGEKQSLVAALTDELFMQHGLKPTDLLELPYPNVKPRARK